MLETIKGVIFDLDGVLCDTAKYHYLAWKRLAEELGFFFSEKDNERLKGVSRMRSLDILLEVGHMTATPEQKEVYATKKNGWYVEYISKMTEEEILPGVLDYLTYLRSRGIKTAIGSASKNTGIILSRLKLGPYFDAIVDGNDVSRAKPDPEVFLVAAERLGLAPSDCAVIEDAEAGIAAAKAGGMLAIGKGDPAILGAADMVIQDLTELIPTV